MIHLYLLLNSIYYAYLWSTGSLLVIFHLAILLDWLTKYENDQDYMVTDPTEYWKVIIIILFWPIVCCILFVASIYVLCRTYIVNSINVKFRITKIEK